MKRIVFLTVILLVGLLPAGAREYEVSGPEGGLAMKVALPDGFNPDRDECPMVLLMHGIFSSKDYNPMPSLAKALAKAGIASILQDMTIEKEIADAMAIWEFAKSLPYVTQIGLLGHSQGGVIASMTAGRLAAAGGAVPAGVVLLAPGSVIKQACQGGKFFNARFDPANPPEYIRCWGTMKLGREYLLTTQQLDIYGTAASYKGPVLLLHGTKDSIVPMWCSEQYLETYGDRATLVKVDGENHLITRRKKEICNRTVAFFREVLGN